MRVRRLDSGLVVPYNRAQEQKELWDKRMAAQKEMFRKYNENHRRCPDCSGLELETTLMGCIQMTDDHVDSNYAYCSCGWKGIVHDLLPFNHIRHMKDVMHSGSLESKLPICPVCHDTKNIEGGGTVPCIPPARERLTCTKCRVSWDMVRSDWKISGQPPDV